MTCFLIHLLISLVCVCVCEPHPVLGAVSCGGDLLVVTYFNEN